MPVRSVVSPYEFRGCKLTLLRYVDKLLWVGGRWCLRDLLSVARANIRSTNGSLRAITGLHVTEEHQRWFYSDFLRRVDSIHEQYRQEEGYLYNIIARPVSRTEDVAVFTAAVEGLGSQHWSEYGMGRMEWLALEVVTNARKILEESRDGVHATEWCALEDLLRCKRDCITLDILWAPHKIGFDGQDMYIQKFKINIKNKNIFF